MTKIKVEYKIDYLNESDLNSLCNLFDDFEASWKICEDVIPLSLEITPIMNKDSSKVVISFEGNLQCDVNITENGIYNLHFEKDDVFKTKTRFELGIYHLEEYFENEINHNILVFLYSLFLVNPNVNLGGGCVCVYLNGTLYKRIIQIESGIQGDLIDSNVQIFAEQLTLQQCWDWITTNTSFGNKANDTPIAFSALTYILNRDLHESLIYSLIGLESIYCSKSASGISSLLRKRICSVFPEITDDQIKDLYKSRSKFVHGETSMGVFYIIRDVIAKEELIYKSALLGAGLLIESIRKLIKNNSRKFVFAETITFEFE